jgi:hypothetical protein
MFEVMEILKYGFMIFVGQVMFIRSVVSVLLSLVCLFLVACTSVPQKVCGPCPQFMPPGPDFCKDGKIVGGGKNDCGCQMPPRCEQIACTADAKVCPDGSSVGRIGPDCEFAPCLSGSVETSECVCPEGYRKEEDACTPECYYSKPPCLAPSIACEQAR